jgi:VanZ family protein
MLPLRRVQSWRLANAGLLLLVLVMTLMPEDWFWPGQRPAHDWIENADKWLHGLTFAFLAVWFAGQYAAKAYWKIGIGLMVYGLLIEVCQWLVGYRMAESLDIAADTIGIVIGLALASAGLGGWAPGFEAWMARRAPGIGDE